MHGLKTRIHSAARHEAQCERALTSSGHKNPELVKIVEFKIENTSCGQLSVVPKLVLGNPASYSQLSFTVEKLSLRICQELLHLLQHLEASF